MEKDTDTIGGYDIAEINTIADEIFQGVVELNIPNRLAILGLCRAITIIGSEVDLDMACRYIDQLSEIPYTDDTLADFVQEEIEADDVDWTDE